MVTPGSQRVIDWRNRTKQKMITAMGGKCQCCGYDKCDAALEFHHIDPMQKDFTFGRVRANPATINVIAKELEKCIMICANCHREVHAGILAIPKEFSRFDRSVFFNPDGTQKIFRPKRKSDGSRDKLQHITNDMIIETYTRHHSIAKTAKEFGVTRAAIDKTVKRRVITLPPRPMMERKKRMENFRSAPLSHIDDYQFLMFFREKGMNKSRLAVHLGVSETAIRKRLKKIHEAVDKRAAMD